MTQIEVKLVAIFVIFATAVLGGGLVFRAQTKKVSQNYFSLGACLGAGVFLGAGLIHLLPDSIGIFSEIAPDVDYPLPAFLAGCGILLVLLVEQVVVSSDAEEAAKGTSAYALLLVLSLHSILAGVALGVESSAVGSLAILLAIVSHKGSAAFALAVGMQRAGIQSNRAWKLLILFSLTTPFGVALGLAGDLALQKGSAQVFEMVFDALAAGTFLYIALSDILADEFLAAENRKLAFGFTAAGLALMALVALWL